MSEANANPGWAAPREPEIHSYTYPEMPWSDELHGWGHAFGRASLDAVDQQAGGLGADRPAAGDAVDQAASADPRSDSSERAERDAQWVARLAEESRQAMEKGRREGFAMGLERGREEAAEASRAVEERWLRQGTALAASFDEERARYFHHAEEEVVRLALAIAARILRREALIDPLLLTGAVRVALGQLAQSTSVRVHIPEVDRTLWEEAFARMPNLESRPEVIGDAEMELGACRVETELGSADLSLWAQLKEIERGFFDRVATRGVAGDAIDEPKPARARAHAADPAAGEEPPRHRPDAGREGPPSRPSPQATAPAASPVDEHALASAAYNEREW